MSYALTPVGLREALRWLGDGEIKPDQGARVLAFLSEAAQRFGHARGLSIVVSPFFGERAAARFAALDADLFQVSQPNLFETPSDRERETSGAPYACGFDLLPAAPGLASQGPNAGSGEALILAASSSGALHPAALLRALARGPSTSEWPLLAAFERLERQRSRLRGGAHALYALPPAGDLSGDLCGDGSGDVSEISDTDAELVFELPKPAETGDLYASPEARAATKTTPLRGTRIPSHETP